MVFVMGSKRTTLLLLEWINKARKEHFLEDTITPSWGKELQHRGIASRFSLCWFFGRVPEKSGRVTHKFLAE